MRVSEHLEEEKLSHFAVLRPVAKDAGFRRCESSLPLPDDPEQIAPIHLTGNKEEWGPQKNAEDIGGYWDNQQFWDLAGIRMAMYLPRKDDHGQWENDENPGFCRKAPQKVG